MMALDEIQVLALTASENQHALAATAWVSCGARAEIPGTQKLQ